VVPLIRENELIGVLDLDSPSLGRFDDEDAAGLEAVAKLLAEKNAGD
jgi:GAF domain-containing protein